MLEQKLSTPNDRSYIQRGWGLKLKDEVEEEAENRSLYQDRRTNGNARSLDQGGLLETAGNVVIDLRFESNKEYIVANRACEGWVYRVFCGPSSFSSWGNDWGRGGMEPRIFAELPHRYRYREGKR